MGKQERQQDRQQDRQQEGSPKFRSATLLGWHEICFARCLRAGLCQNLVSFLPRWRLFSICKQMVSSPFFNGLRNPNRLSFKPLCLKVSYFIPPNAMYYTPISSKPTHHIRGNAQGNSRKKIAADADRFRGAVSGAWSFEFLFALGLYQVFILSQVFAS